MTVFRKGTAVAIVWAALLLLGSCEADYRPRLSLEQARQKLADLLQRTTWRTETVKRVKLLEFAEKRSLLDTLPHINTYAMAVDPPLSARDVGVEIFSST